MRLAAKEWVWLQKNGFGCKRMVLAVKEWVWLQKNGFGCKRMGLAAKEWVWLQSDGYFFFLNGFVYLCRGCIRL